MKKTRLLPIISLVFAAICAVSFAACKGEAHKHELASVSAKAATCTEEGYEAYEYCTAEGCDYSTKKTIAALGHELKMHEGKEATCSEAGYEPYHECVRKNCAYNDKIEIPKKAHELAVVSGRAATYTQNGFEEYEKCINCGYTTERVKIPALGHNVQKGVCVNRDCTFNVGSLVDFRVEIPSDKKEAVILHLTDPQLIDPAKSRTANRLGSYHKEFWKTSNLQKLCYDYLTETINATNPDFIIVTGDLVYGEFDDDGELLTSFINFMESFGIPWSPVFGNHENESKMGADWQCKQLEEAENCLFKQRALTGNGNYSVGIMQGTELKRVFYMLDSNGCGSVSAESYANGHTKTSAGFGDDQINWYTSTIKLIRKYSEETKISFAYHIQQAVFADAFEKYGFKKGTPINIFTAKNRADGDFGYLGRGLKTPWDDDGSVWKGMKELGVDSVFVGHEHCNAGSVMYDGVLFQYGQKGSEYDRYNSVNPATLAVTGDYPSEATKKLVPLIGGISVNASMTDGTITGTNLYLCKNAGGDVFK